MSNTSATGGYLKELPGITGKKEHENAVHGMIAGLTGISETLVRPAFQENPLKAPDPKDNVDWCAFYIRDSAATNYPYVAHISDADGSDVVVDWVDKEITAYFYGPNCETLAGMVRRGLHVEQNRHDLRQAGISIRRVGSVEQMPELVNGKWHDRADLTIFATFRATGTYRVLNLLQSGGTILSDEIRGGTQFSVPFDTDNVTPDD